MAENSLSSPHSQKRKMSIFKWRSLFLYKKKTEKKKFSFLAFLLFGASIAVFWSGILVVSGTNQRFWSHLRC